MRYSDIQPFVQAALTEKGYGTPGGPAMPYFDPGPLVEKKLNIVPGPILFLVVGNGIGLAHEDLFDIPFITVRVTGAQNDYGYAETLARDVDDILLTVGGSTTIGTLYTLFITRTGGAPQLIDFDAAERYSFQATYIAEVKR